jgi:DNA-binding transcriptional LysR family regulator
MELRHLRYFVAVAQRKHFTQAADELHLAQPALSRQIQQLEQELGIELLVRTSRRVRLTAAGEAFLVRAEHILAEVERARMEMQEFAGLIYGRLMIGALQSLDAFGFTAMLARFHARYPGIEIILQEEATEKLFELLCAGQLDLSLLQIRGEELPDELLASPVATEKLLTEEVVLVVSANHALAHAQQVTIDELRDEPFVAFKPGFGLRQIMQQSCLSAGFSPRILFESGNLDTIRSMVAEGLGISILPRSVAISAGRKMTAISFRPDPLLRTILLAWHAHSYRSPTTTAFLSFFHQDIQEHPWRESRLDVE